MNDVLPTMMRESAETIDTSPAPLAAITRAGRRRRARLVVGGAVAAVLVAGTAAVAVPSLTSDRAGGPAAPTRDYGRDEVPVFLPTSAYDIGVDEAPVAKDVLEGELRSVMDDRCLDVGDERLLVFWPHGWEGLTLGDDRFELLDQDGRLVASVGDDVRVEGIRTDGGVTYSGEDVCSSGASGSFMVTSLEVLD